MSVKIKQLSDLKNPKFEPGDKVRVIANSLKEFNPNWTRGNNANFNKGYIGIVEKCDGKSCFSEVDTWIRLEGSPYEISCNLLELVEEKKEFKKGDYIVLTEGYESPTFKLNTCYKQREDCKYIRPELDSNGSCNNGWGKYHYNKSKRNNWRYATREEVAKYDRLGKPYDITTLGKKLTVNNLVEGEIYYCKYKGIETLFQINQNIYIYNDSLEEYSWKYWEVSSSTDLRLATSQEKKWLNICIKEDKFIPKNELDNYDDVTFEFKEVIPEYVECIRNEPKKKPFEFNKWYKLSDRGLVYPKSPYTGYGFCMIGNWFINNDGKWRLDYLTPATKEEVEERLLKEARKRYPEGTIFKCLYFGDIKTVKGYQEQWYDNNLVIRSNEGSACIYSNGEWAEIIKDEGKETKDKKNLSNKTTNLFTKKSKKDFGLSKESIKLIASKTRSISKIKIKEEKPLNIKF